MHALSPCSQCNDDLAAALEPGALRVRFRPIADFRKCSIMGHIAVVRGPAYLLNASYRRLVRMAHSQGRGQELALASVNAALQQFAQHQGSGLLFVPLPESVLEQHNPQLIGRLEAIAQWHEMSPEGIVFSLPEVGLHCIEPALKTLAGLRQAGFRLAQQDYSCDLTREQIFRRITPHFLVLDEQVFDGNDGVGMPDERLVASLTLRREGGCRIVADGIGSKTDFYAVRRLDIEFGAGSFIGQASPLPSRALTAIAHKSIAAYSDDPRQYEGVRVERFLDRLLVRTEQISPDANADQVFERFERDPDLRAIAVVADGLPLGLISRYEMIDKMSRPYRHELFGRKSCTRFMDPQPLVVEVGVSLTELTEIVVGADPRHLISGFIITEGGRYLGMGSVQDLVREVSAMQMEAARYANPLTQLPGNVPTRQRIDQLLNSGQPFCIAYCDLDHFKPFNDAYGYAKGDEIIQLTAELLSATCLDELDYLGHIGGDDFILIFCSAGWQARCQAALEQFGTRILSFFSHDDIERGGYLGENRKGEIEFHRLTALSIGALEVTPGRFHNYLELSKAAADVKKRAKAIPGNSLHVGR